MSKRTEKEIYSRINVHMGAYIQAVNDQAVPEELHYKLRDLLEEAIKVDISLEKLLEAFSDSTVSGGKTSEFIDNVSKQYGYGGDAAKVTV